LETLEIRNSRSVVTFHQLARVPVPVRDVLVPSISLWNLSCFSNGFREFSFKLRNNYLNLNNRRAAYDNNANPLCTFCRIRDPDGAPRESFNHAFLACPSVSRLVDFMSEYFDIAILNPQEFLSFYWHGHIEGHENLQLVFLSFWEIVRYNIYRYKTRNTIPNTFMIMNNSFFDIKTSIFSVSVFRQQINDSPVLARWIPALG
jgi:hypothetical protein